MGVVMARKAPEAVLACPCGSGQLYGNCCEAYILEVEPAPTAELLMRSRYTAFALGEAPYLLASWHPNTRPSRIRLDPQQRWIGLAIKSTGEGGAEDDSGTVEFVARFKVDGKGHRLHERSYFEKISGRWYYKNGDHL